MINLSKKLKFIIFTTIVIIISFLFIIVSSKTYTINYSPITAISDVESLNVKIENENIANYTDKRIENGVLKIKIEPKSQGKTYININNPQNDFSLFFTVYVHKFGGITFGEFMGNFTGSIIIPISIIIILVYALHLLISSYKQCVKVNMYQYKNIAYLGIIVFVILAIFSQILAIMSNYSGPISTINSLINMFSFEIMLLPITFILSILVLLSNISLIRKEGFNVRNVLGIAFGAFLCISTLLPDKVYQALYSASWIDVHNQQGLGLYIYNLVESILHITTTYIECVLIGTIIMGFKSAKHIPAFDKDYIIILGCQIKKDGTLTNLLRGRVDKAIKFSKMQKEKTGKNIVFVPSGGKGSDEIISEAQAMKNYLIEQGVNEENILLEDRSKNTFENIKFSNEIIKTKMKNAKIAFSTTNYHVLRAGSIATEQDIIVEGIGAKTKSYFWINAFIREFIATLFSEKKKHIAIICSIILLTTLMIVITYLNNII